MSTFPTQIALSEIPAVLNFVSMKSTSHAFPHPTARTKMLSGTTGKTSAWLTGIPTLTQLGTIHREIPLLIFCYLASESQLSVVQEIILKILTKESHQQNP